MRKNSLFRALTLLVLILPIYLTFFANKSQIGAIPPKNVKDVLSNSQFSFYGGLGIGTSTGDTVIKLDVSTFFPSKTSNNLFVGDTLSIGTGGSQTTFYVKDIGNTSQIMISAGISAPSAVAGGSVISTSSAVHTVYFDPQVNTIGGFWQVLIKATSGLAAEKSSDAIPDQQGFDLGTLNAGAVSCPFGGVASVGTTTVVTLGSPPSTSYYHVIQCTAPTGNITGVGTGTTMVIGLGNSMLINPSPSNTAAQEGTANVFNFMVRHLDSSSVLLDQTPGKIAVVEAVRVTATVDPTITFSIGTSNTSTAITRCGSKLAANATLTTGDQVVFGSLAIGSTANQLAQTLTCNTNAAGGYAVSVYEANAMTNINNSAITIPDFSTSYSGAAAVWTLTSYGFGYSMEAIGGGASIPYTGATGTFRAFGIGSGQAQDIMKNISTPVAAESAYICYRINVSNSQQAGDYEGNIVYTATATF